MLLTPTRRIGSALALAVASVTAVTLTVAGLSSASAAELPTSFQLIAEVAPGDYIAVTDPTPKHPGVPIEHFTSVTAARAAAFDWVVQDAGDGAFKLAVVDASNTGRCLEPHDPFFTDADPVGTIPTLCDPNLRTQEMTFERGGLRFAEVYDFQKDAVWLDVASFHYEGEEYLQRSTTPTAGWMGFTDDGDPGEQPFTATWAFHTQLDQPSVLTGTGRPGTAITAHDQAETTVAGPVAVDADGTWSMEVPAPNRGGRYDLAVRADGDLEGQQAVSLDYGRPVQITSPAAGESVGTGPIVVEGTGEPGASVEIALAGRRPVTVTVDASGNWTTTIP